MQKIAQVLKSNGCEGELVLSLVDIAPEDIDLQEPVFIEMDGLPVPYFIESCTRRGNSRLLVHLTGVRSLEDADELAGKDVLADYFEEQEEDSLVGWTVLDEKGEMVGKVADYEDIPGNLCVWVNRPGRGEVLLPLHEDLIVEMNEKTAEIRLRIPDGLL